MKAIQCYLDEKVVIADPLELGISDATSTSLLFVFHIIAGIATITAYSKYLISKSWIDNNLTKQLKKLITGEWEVRIVSMDEPNAFTIGKKQLYVTTGLKALLPDEKELMSVVLHEAGHTLKYHSMKRLTLHSATSSFFYSISFILSALSIPTAIVFIFASIIVDNLIYNYYSRLTEQQADSYAVKIGYGKEFAAALRKFHKLYGRNRKPVDPSSKIERFIKKLGHLFDSHPRDVDRIKDAIKNSKDVRRSIAKGTTWDMIRNISLAVGINPDEAKKQPEFNKMMKNISSMGYS